MTDHVARMVNMWFARAQSAEDRRDSLQHLVDAIHRMVREAEDETRRRCEDVALQTAGPEVGSKVALAIRMANEESLPRKSLIEIHAPDLTQ
jgi:hypothetical protein